ncbi:DUF2845 domain-containing protein [Luteibacter rhizovicinus]|nr:DUF2845 domain-containing protein [Luteibacter rhizovicinus]
MAASFVLALCVAGVAFAGSTVRIGSSVLSVGDSEGKVYQVAGKPSRTRPIEAAAGGYEGDRLDYDVDHKTVQIFIRNGRVDKIVEIDS